jgi:hypothetical protein
MTDENETTQSEGNGSGPPTAEPTELKDLPAELMPFARYFGMPVAVQLNYPLAVMDFGNVIGAPGAELGTLQAAKADDGGIPSTTVVMGLMIPSPCGKRLIVQMESVRGSGAILEASVRPEDVRYVTCVARVPSQIVRAG